MITEPSPLTREELIELLGEAVRKTHARFNAARFRERETDQVWAGMGRLLSTLGSTLNSVMRDRELAAIEERLQTLEERLK